MNFNIRGAIFHNIKEMREEELTHMIQDSIQKGDEKYLPGLGVLFEVIWNHSKADQRDQMIQLLQEQISKEQNATPFS